MIANQVMTMDDEEESTLAEPAKTTEPHLKLLPEGSRAEFSRLMREHHLNLIVFAGALTVDRDAAKDLAQDALVAAWRKFDQFDPEKGDFGAWVRGIIRFKAKDYFRRLQRIPIPNLELVEMEVDLTAWQSARAAGTGVFEIIEVCLSKLPEKLRDAVQQFYFEDRCGDDAAQLLEISPANLRKRLERARGLLHDCISVQTQAESP
jgi:RNA polymerase sigma factor (sigma-70 family)